MNLESGDRFSIDPSRALPEEPIITAIAHPSVMSVAGVRTFLEGIEGITIAAVARMIDSRCVKTSVMDVDPDLAVVGTEFRCGPSATSAIRDMSDYASDTGVIAIGRNESRYRYRRVVTAGADAYVTEQVAPRDFMAAVESVLKGDTWYSSRFPSPENLKPTEKYTDERVQWARCFIEGVTTEEAAQRMDITQAAVYKHKSRMKSELRIEDDRKLLEELKWIFGFSPEPATEQSTDSK